MLFITKLLPKGDLPPPNVALQVEWFHMSFHCSDCTEYIRGRRKLRGKMLQTLAEYFESIFLACISDGLILRKYDKQLCSAAKHKLCHELKKRCREKLKRLLESRERHYSCAWHHKHHSRSTCDGRPTRYGNCCCFKARCSGYKYSCVERKPPPEDGKFNKPCHLHGTNTKHSYDECRQNPKTKNQACANNNNNYVKKRANNVHYHDGHRHGSDNKSLVSCASPALNDSDLSGNKSGGNCTPDNYQLDSFHIPKKRKLCNVGHKSPENNALVEAGVSPELDAIFKDDVTMDSFLKAFQKDLDLSMRDTNDAFKFKN